MAENDTIIIKFEAQGDKSLVTAIKALDRATKSMINTQKGLSRSTGKIIPQQAKMRKGMLGLGHSARQTGGAFSVLRSKLLLLNFALGLGIRQLVGLSKEAASLEALETAFNTLASGGGNASDAIIKLRNATDNTVSSMDLFKQANSAMILGVSKNADEMANMFDMAQRLGRALGQDTRSSIESFVTGVGRQSRLMLDNIGIIVKTEVAYKAYATELNKSTDELTILEQKQAFLNATLVAGKQKLRALGVETLASADKLMQMNTTFIELRQELGEQLLPIIISITDSMNDFMKSLDSTNVRQTISSLKTMLTIFVTFQSGKLLLGFANGITTITIALRAMGVAGGFATAGLSLLAAIIATGITKGIYSMIDAEAQHTIIIEKKKGILKDLKKLYQDQIVSMQDYSQGLEDSINMINAERDVAIQSITDKKLALQELDKMSKMSYESIIEMQKNQSDQAKISAMLTKNLTDEEKLYFQDYVTALTAIMLAKKKQYDADATNYKKSLSDQKTALDDYLQSLKDAVAKIKGWQQKRQEANEALITNTNNTLSAISRVDSAWSSHLQSRISTEVATLKDSARYQNADAERRSDMEREITKKYAKEQLIKFRIGQGMALADIGMNTSSALMKSVAGSWQTIGQPWFSIIAGLGALQAGIVLSQKPPQAFAKGGDFVTNKPEMIMVGEAGREHVTITPIDRPESRALKDGSSINITIQGGIVDQSYVSNELIPAINKATSLGVTLA
jgi:hypothetical protein